jgi:hypothetical protein
MASLEVRKPESLPDFRRHQKPSFGSDSDDKQMRFDLVGAQ